MAFITVNSLAELEKLIKIQDELEEQVRRKTIGESRLFGEVLPEIGEALIKKPLSKLLAPILSTITKLKLDEVFKDLVLEDPELQDILDTARAKATEDEKEAIKNILKIVLPKKDQGKINKFIEELEKARIKQQEEAIFIEEGFEGVPPPEGPPPPPPEEEVPEVPEVPEVELKPPSRPTFLEKVVKTMKKRKQSGLSRLLDVKREGRLGDIGSVAFKNLLENRLIIIDRNQNKLFDIQNPSKGLVNLLAKTFSQMEGKSPAQLNININNAKQWIAIIEKVTTQKRLNATKDAKKKVIFDRLNKKDIDLQTPFKKKKGKAKKGEGAHIPIQGQGLTQLKRTTRKSIRNYKIDNNFIFGNKLFVQPQELLRLRLKVKDINKNRVVMNRKVDLSTIELITKRFNPKTNYSNKAKSTLRDLIMLGDLPILSTNRKYKLISGGQAFGSFGGLGRKRQSKIVALSVKTPSSVEIFTSIDEIVTRLDNLIAERASGNTNKTIVNEIVELGDVLLSKGVLDRQSHKNLLESVL